MIAIEARSGIAVVAGIIAVWVAVRTVGAPTSAPAFVDGALVEPSAAALEQRWVAYEVAPPTTIEEIMAERDREARFLAACFAGGGRACCGQGGCCPGETQSRAAYEALIHRLTDALQSH